MKKKPKKNAKSNAVRILGVKHADKNNVVVSIAGGGGEYQKVPCAQCPWRVDQTGSFPAEAFRISANTAEDMSMHCFACHMAGKENPRTCAGFILNGSDDNLAVRFKKSDGLMLDVSDGGHELHASYAQMSIANGVPENDPAIQGCMPEARDRFWESKERKDRKKINSFFR